MLGKHLAHRGKIVAVADIGSASAAVALVALRPNSPAEVLVAERSTLPMEERTKEATVAQIGGALVEAGEKAGKAYAAQKGAAPRVESLYCVIRAPWSRSITVQAYSQSEAPTKVTEAMIAALARRALGEQAELDPKNILEASVVRVELNGYPTGVPAGKLARELGVWALVSDCDPALRAKIQASLQSLFPHLTPAFRSSTRAALAVLHELPQAEKDYFMVDIAGESATLIVVRNGTIAGQHLIQGGVRGILKRIAPTGMAEETLGLVRMLGRDQCSAAACEAIQSAMQKIEPELVRSYAEGMAACALKERLPTALTLIVQPDMAPWLSKFFSRIDFTQFTRTTQPFSVEVITPKNLSRYVVPTGGVVLDTGVALSTALVKREQST